MTTDAAKAYTEWLASAPSNAAIIETIDVAHYAWGNWRIAKWGTDITLRDETGGTQTFKAGFFKLTKPEASDTLEQVAQISISSMDGALYNILRGMNAEQRATPITITYRLVRSDTIVAGVHEPLLVNPPPVWNVHTINASITALVAEVRADPLRIRRVGTYYTENYFPVLVYA